jgi:LysR family hydrogen peroxide-inducible transcriptional activator
MTLTQLQYIIAVERSGSFSKAADECFVTQPTLSMQIRELEKELGVIIFRRDKHPIQPTEIGRKVLEQAKQIITGREKLHAILQVEKKDFAGKLRIGIIPTVSGSLLPRFLGSFHSEYPEIELIVDEITTAEIINQLDKGKLDIGIIARTSLPGHFIFESLYSEPFVVLLPFGHRLETKTMLKPADININELLLLKEGHCLRDQILEICSEDKSHADKNITFESGNLWTIIQLVEQKFGTTFLPYLSIDSLSSKLKKQIREFKPPVPAREIGLLYHDSYIKLHLVNALKNKILSSLPYELIGKTRTKMKTIA